MIPYLISPRKLLTNFPTLFASFICTSLNEVCTAISVKLQCVPIKLSASKTLRGCSWHHSICCPRSNAYVVFKCSSFTAGKFDRRSHFIPIFIARKLAKAWSLGTYLWTWRKKHVTIPKPNFFTISRTQGIFRVCDLISCNLAEKQINNFVLLLRSSILLIFQTTETISTGVRIQDSLSGCDLCSCKLLFERNSSSWRRTSILLTSPDTGNIFIRTRTQDNSSGLWPLFFCDLPFETNHSVLAFFFCRA